MDGNITISIVLIIITKYMTLGDGVLVVRNNGLSNLQIEGDSKIVISGLPCVISSCVEDIWSIFQYLNIFKYFRIYRVAIEQGCSVENGRYSTDSNICRSKFPMNVKKIAFKDCCSSSFNCYFISSVCP